MDLIRTGTQDCFSAISQIRRLDPSSPPQPELLQQRLCQFIEQMQERLRADGFSVQDVGDIAYAIVALADEVALNAGTAISSYWMGNLLQFKYFRENTAGDGFFSRLEAIRRDPHRWGILRAYQWCLLLGFQGKYRIRGGELELMSLIESLQREVGRPTMDTEILSPHGERPAEVFGGAKRTAPVVMISLIAAAVALLVFVSLRVALMMTASSAAEEMSNVHPPAEGAKK